jgi:PAS domain S-box-containing protein
MGLEGHPVTPSPAEVLVVEDDDAHAALIERHFEQHEPRMHLVRVASLRAARAHLAASSVDLVISDLRLPDGSGGELLEAGSARVPLVVMTSFGDQQVAVEAMRRGALDYVVKSAATLEELPRIAERALREWGHLLEKRQALEALRISEAHFRSLIENGLDLIAVVDTSAVLRYASPSARHLLGRDPSELVGTPWLELVHPDDGPAARRALEGALSAPDARQFALLRLRARDDRWPTFDAIARGLRNGTSATEVVVNARDVSERLRAERRQQELESQLRQAQKLETLGTLAGGIAHDFNNVLQAVMGCTELALARLGTEAAVRGYLERALEVTRRARELVRQIVQFAQQAEPRREPVALDTLVHETCSLLRATAPATVEIGERIVDAGAVLGDAAQIRQVLMNLATNALQAMGVSGGRLEIGLERGVGGGAALLPEGAYLALSVSDTGPGIATEIQERVFEPFFTTRGVGGGAGLGLSVAHGIVRSHGGAIACESVPGQGAVFRVYLPERGVSASPAEGRHDAGSPLRARVLLADDDENIRYVGRAVLEGLGHVVHCVADGLEALEAFSSEPDAFDLIIADELMPRMTGSQLVTEVRRSRPELPFVITSGHGLPGHARWAERGAVVFLAKPFEVQDLARAIGVAVQRSRRVPGEA